MLEKIIILIFAFLLNIGSIFAQEDFNKAQRAPQTKEMVLIKETRTRSGHDNLQSAYKAALREAQRANPQKKIGIRNLTKGDVKVNGDGSVSHYYTYTVVELPDAVARKMYVAINKAIRTIDDGNRFAVDNISITDGKSDKEKIKGQVVDYLLGKNYKVVAKDYLKKLYKEQQGQQSGIYNEETTIKGNNFSAVGYFLTVHITEEYVQVQVVNVSTGEYVGNAIENF